MLERAFAAGVPASRGCMAVDSVYGDARRLRLWLETPAAKSSLMCMAVSSKEHVWLGGMPQRSGEMPARLQGLDEDAWSTTLSAGSRQQGAKALRSGQCD